MSTNRSSALQDLRVLIVEDNYILAESIQWALGGMGCRVVGPAPTSERALSLLATHEVDAAVLDIDLRGCSSVPVAEYLRSQGIPFLFLTGYDSATVLPEAFHGQRCLNKPVDPEEVADALSQEVG